MVTHVVMLHLSDKSAAPEVVRRMLAMKGQIPTLRDIEVGIDVWPEPRSADVCLITRFDDRAGLDAYQVHPVHQEVLAYVRTVTERTVKVDFVS